MEDREHVAEQLGSLPATRCRGTDELHGGENNDLMYGGDAGMAGNTEAESDTLYGENGNDTLYGEGGNDSLDPGNHVDVAYGGDGNDTFVDSQDNFFDWLDGGNGTDSAGDYDSPGDSVFNFP